jgi:DNA repair protein RecO (recombination protein O)
MIETATGLVLRVRPLTETSLIIHWLTPDLGRLAMVAKGARRAKSPFRGQLDLFYLANLSFMRSRRTDLHALREVRLVETHNLLRRELGCLQQASYCAALIEQATETETPLRRVFELMRELLETLCQGGAKPQLVPGFELKLLRELGLEPDLAKTHLTAGAKEIVKALAEANWETILRLKLSKAQAAEVRQFLHGFLIFHLGKIPASRGAALEA